MDLEHFNFAGAYWAWFISSVVFIAAFLGIFAYILVRVTKPKFIADDPMLDALHKLAMLGLQSDRYRTDMDFRDAVDDAMAILKDRGGLPYGSESRRKV